MKALIPGSFDPMTLGHLDILERSAPMFEKIYVAVMNNDMSKYEAGASSKTYMFTPEQRLQIVRSTISGIPNAEAVLWQGRLIDFCDEYDTVAVIRGVRDFKDFEYECIHAKYNREHNARAQALFMPAQEGLCKLSSTKIRQAIAKGDLLSLEGSIHPNALAYIKSIKQNSERN